MHAENIYNGFAVRAKPRTDIKTHYIFFFLVFLVNPLFSILFLAFHIKNQNIKTDELFYLLYILISLYLGLITTTKVPVSDFLNHKMYFENASNTDFIDYISQFNEEYLFYAATYLSNKLLFGNFDLYTILIIFISYMLVFAAIHKYWKDKDASLILFSVLTFALFNRVFFSSSHLIRQMLAGTIFMYFWITRTVDKKTRWWLIPAGYLIHASSAALFLLSFLPNLEKKISLKNGIIFFGIVVIVIFFGANIYQIMHSLTKSVPILNYPFQKMELLKFYGSGWYEGSGEGGYRYWYYVQLLPAVGFAYFFAKKERVSYAVLNYTLLMIVVLEFFVFSGMSFLQLRFMRYVYLLVPFIYPYFFTENKCYNYKPLKFLGMAFIALWFLYRFAKDLTSGLFDFAPLMGIIANPVPLYFID